MTGPSQLLQVDLYPPLEPKTIQSPVRHTCCCDNHGQICCSPMHFLTVHSSHLPSMESLPHLCTLLGAVNTNPRMGAVRVAAQWEASTCFMPAGGARSRSLACPAVAVYHTFRLIAEALLLWTHLQHVTLVRVESLCLTELVVRLEQTEDAAYTLNNPAHLSLHAGRLTKDSKTRGRIYGQALSSWKLLCLKCVSSQSRAGLLEGHNILIYLWIAWYVSTVYCAYMSQLYQCMRPTKVSHVPQSRCLQSPAPVRRVPRQVPVKCTAQDALLQP